MQRTRSAPRPHAHGCGVDHDAVAAAEAQHRHRLADQRRVDELALGAVLERQRLVGLGVDQLDVDVRVAAEVHAGLLLALAPQRGRDVGDAHRLAHRGAERLLDRVPGRVLAAARLAGDREDAHAELARLEVALAAPVGEVERVGRRAAERLGAEALERLDQPLGVAAPDRDDRGADALPGVEHRARHERARVVGEDGALTGGDARRGVGARADVGPRREVGVGDRDVGRVAGGAARRVDAPDALERRGEMAAQRRLGGQRLADLVLRRERQRLESARPRSPASLSR